VGLFFGEGEAITVQDDVGILADVQNIVVLASGGGGSQAACRRGTASCGCAASACHDQRLVAFSCKRRGFCPSFGARRMVESAELPNETKPGRQEPRRRGGVLYCPEIGSLGRVPGHREGDGQPAKRVVPLGDAISLAEYEHALVAY
jgi:hypothetical protein